MIYFIDGDVAARQSGNGIIASLGSGNGNVVFRMSFEQACALIRTVGAQLHEPHLAEVIPFPKPPKRVRRKRL